MTESPDSEADISAEVPDSAEDTKAATPAAKTKKPKGDQPEIPRRERLVRLALVTVGAALVASIFSLYAQRGDGDPAARAGATAEAASGTVTVEIEVSADGSNQSAKIETRYFDDDFDATIRTSGGDNTSSPQTSTQQLVVVGGQHHYRRSPGAWATVEDGTVVVLDEHLDLPARSAGWTIEGLRSFVAALDLAPDNTVVTDVTKASISVAEARSIGEVPLAIEVLIDEAWDWSDDQTIEVEVDTRGGTLRALQASAVDDRGGSLEGRLAITTSTSYVGLGDGTAVSVPDESTE